ncbi:MAG TPA: hypothetical protein V6C86_26050 [Oculatellaceae cyanobacterium]
MGDNVDKAADNDELVGNTAMSPESSAAASTDSSATKPSEAVSTPPKKKKKKKKKQKSLTAKLLLFAPPLVAVVVGLVGMSVYFRSTNESYKFGSRQTASVPEGIDVSKVKPEDMQAFLRFKYEKVHPPSRKAPNPDFDISEKLSGKENSNWAALYEKATQLIADDVDYASAEQPLRKALALARKGGSKRELYLSLSKLEDVLNVEKRYGAADELDKEVQTLLESGKSKGAAASK